MRATITTALAVIGLCGASLLAAPSVHAAVSPCTGDDLAAKVTGTDAGANEQVVSITVRKTGRKRCYVSGYPFLARMVAKEGTKVFTQAKGGTPLAPNPPRERIILKRGQRAHFAVIGTMPEGSTPTTFRRLRFAPTPGVTPISVDIRLAAGRVGEQPYRFTTTAYARGAGKAS